ncbi:unnamed protein product [Linum tenue]|uniref:C2 domain-containing protein n=1 Tax=Linum tenue TaxID=586396 RepID=A0AAV0RZ44_9ROSI|nr:unnamed protein product [Linum tenue]
MFEAHVLHLLRSYLGEYVHGLSSEALRISVWKGDVVLKDLKLKAEALNSLKLPVTVKAGFVGTITLKVPWKSLGKEPVIVLIDQVFILAHPASDDRTLKEEDRIKLFEAKLQQIEDAESAILEGISKSKQGSPLPGDSWLGSLMSTVMGNLKISISNVHVRYEDSSSNPGHPFSCGVTLAKLAAVTTDDEGNETFDASGALDKLSKSLHLARLAMYHNSESLPWKINKPWESLTPKEWVEIFEDGINEPAACRGPDSKWAIGRNYLVSPINGVLKYHRLGKSERTDPEVPFEKASLVLTDVSLTMMELQYHDWIKLLEVVSRYKIYVEISHLRPVVPVSQDPCLWWRYAAQANLQLKKMCYRLSWDRIRHLCQCRNRYVQLYAGSLQKSSDTQMTELREIEKDLDPKVILLWRLLAHAKVETAKTKEAAEQRRNRKTSWLSLGWHEDAATELDVSEGAPFGEESLTKEEWQAINNLLSFQPDEELKPPLGRHMQNMIKYLLTVSVEQAAARIIDMNGIEIVCGRFERLRVSTKLRNRSMHCDVLLKFYGVSAPEGSLAQSVSSEQKENALSACFVHTPVGENIDWRLSSTISPCHVTVLMESLDRVFEFMKRSNAVSPTVALETANALQMKIEKVTRRAQEQVQTALEEQCRFAFDIDLDAPIVRVPVKAVGSSTCDTYFLLDFGHFTLHTMENQSDENKQSLYSRFHISGRDIAAFFTDSEEGDFYSMIDRCGMVVIVDQIKVAHPHYPSSRISVQVPNLSIHFSPARYHRLMELLNIVSNTVESCEQSTVNNVQQISARNSADISAYARILVWKGIGNSVATWQQCFLVLSGLYLYVMESPDSRSHQRYLSMAGRQVNEVPSSSVGGSPFCIAVSLRGMDIQQALESSSTSILAFSDEDEKATWLKGLTQTIYQASAPPLLSLLGEAGDTGAELSEPHTPNTRATNLVVNGVLLETKICIYGKPGDEVDKKAEETLIAEVLASGGKLYLIHSLGDLTVKMKLHSLKITDKLQGYPSINPQYLLCSVVKNDKPIASPRTPVPQGSDMSVDGYDDNDTFADALPDFLNLSDSIYSPRLDMSHPVAVSDVCGPSDFDSAEENALQRKCISSEIFYEALADDHVDFVSVVFSTRSSASPDYDGIDTQMSIRMSKLEFFCNRPTLVALIGFGSDLSDGGSVVSSEDVVESVDDKSKSKGKTEDTGHVKGLLGYGKSRVVFDLNMNIDNVTVILNKEDGSQLAMLIQESFLFNLKLHPSSLSIEGTLGNFKLCDMSLGTDHCWSWLCDIRNPGIESIIKFKFNSYSAEDDDYEGYDYSLSGRLSAVRIVFLYRFVREITAYFAQLATPRTEEAIKLEDKVGGFEWLIQKYEIDGATALKLDLSLDTPIIIVPRNTTSKDFIELDLGQLKVSNELSWHGCPEKDPSAVHMDVLHAEILGINMSIGIDGCLGKPMVREGQGLDIYVRRSLRDVFRKVPTFALEVRVGFLHCVMSDKEYKVILDCISINLNEEPSLPPVFRVSKSDKKDPMQLLVDKVNMNSQMLLAHSVSIMAVEINYALLELCNGVHESPLAHLVLEGLWVSYKTTSLSETDLYVTIPKFSIVDIRPGTKPEMRLMLGSSADANKQASSGSLPHPLNKGSFRRVNSAAILEADIINSTMFLLDYRWRPSSQSYMIRIQQPRILVVPDFLLAVGEFFVPSLGQITGREESLDPKKDTIYKSNCIVLRNPVYKQSDDVVHLSANRRLVADSKGVDEYTYDGCGNTIILSDQSCLKEADNFSFQPIIIIGRGKRLRFVNIKIENGFLLSKYTHLSNDSSYSISIEDGVDISLLENPSPEERLLDYMHERSGKSNTFNSQINSDVLPSVSFEAQVVSPELRFYDNTKSSLDDSSYGEKLLRAKMDLSFMYASKENDTWIRAAVKDLSVEAGSGLMILDPVDISGGYTSIKDKTDTSLISTDVCFHLSLSTISLLLNLQSQATAALQFGNAIPLAPCTNFDRIWVSPKENGSRNKLTFWRPRAPANYVILGDCVTSRPIPPSVAVMAVNNSYGRVRKPIGFNLIALLSEIQVFECAGGSELDSDCSIWMPIAPPGYAALGCVAHVGRQPPPNHVVYCLRSDLVSSTTYAECLLCARPQPSSSSGFSIWRMDNVIASFYAHLSSEYPPRDSSCDLSHLLLWNHVNHSSPKDTRLDTNGDDSVELKKRENVGENSSRWDVIRSVSKATNCYVSTPNFERIWWDRGSDVRRPVSIWRPIARPGYAVLGDCIAEGLDIFICTFSYLCLEAPALGIIFKADSTEFASKPVQFTKVSHIMGKGIDEVFFWYPIAPPGYAALGCIVTRVDEPPSANSFCCPRMDLVNQANIIEVPVSRSSNSKASQCWTIWRVENQACTFLARSDLKKPSSKLAFSIGDSTKPKSRENVTAEMKIKCFSVTVLDSLCGMMTPLFDFTITNIKLATHGRMESMNAVLISSIAASTFNTQFEAWEPLVEPFDGIFKFETYDTNVHPPSQFAKRVRIAATSILNMNISAANLETFVGTLFSWRKQLEIDKKATKLNEDSGSRHKPGEEAALSALDEDDFQTVVVENKLGCDLYLKRVEDNVDVVDQLHPNDSFSVWVPPSRFSDRLKAADGSRGARCYVAVHIFEVKDLPILDDGNSHNMFCALRLLVDSQATDQQKFFPQSARTKCVKPLLDELAIGTAKWNELFIFEIPRKGHARLEVEVTNLAAKAGKGEVVGALSLPIGHGAALLKKVASVRMLHQPHNIQNIVSRPLRRKHDKDDDMQDSGYLSVSTTYFEKSLLTNTQRGKETGDSTNRDTGFWVGLNSSGSWESIRSLLPLSVVPKSLQKDFIAMEVTMKNGKKHAIFRALVTVVNDSDIKLDISVRPMCMVDGNNPLSGSQNSTAFIEEVFENQCFHPTYGWGSQCQSSQSSDPGRWSTRDFSSSSKDFFEPPLPPGWQWASSWIIDKSEVVDGDGWAYAPDFHSFKWPPTSHTNSSLDAVRRRRWVRRRQEVHTRFNKDNSDFVIDPGSSAVLPWHSTSKDSDHCLQVRPSAGHSQSAYSWGQEVSVGSSDGLCKDQTLTDKAVLATQCTLKQGSKMPVAFKLNQLEKKDVLCCCSSTENKQFWLSVGADASVLTTELNKPVYDWTISINSPLKLENQLSCSAEFTIWEKAKEGGYTEQQHGAISSWESVHIYFADIHKPIYLTLLVHGGWVMEKPLILLLDLASSDRSSSFWMVHHQSKRRLRVNIERDMGGSITAPKAIKIFVPYWIVNSSSLPLAYRVVETEGIDSTDLDSQSLSRVNSVKHTSKATTMERRPSSMKRNADVVEVIEDTSPVPSMFSLQDPAGRSGVTVLFPSQKDAFLSARVGLAVAVRHSDSYSPGISLLELEKKERVDVKAFSSDGSYYKLSALLKTSERTKVVHFQPHTLFVNRVGSSLGLQQCDSHLVEWVHPTDPPKPFRWQSFARVEMLKLRVEGYQWSMPFSVYNEGTIRISLKSDVGDNQLQLKIQVRNGTKTSRYEVIFRPNSSSSPYRVENRSMFLPIRFRQVDGVGDSWKLILPNTSSSFFWEDLGRKRFLELFIDGSNSSKSLMFDIDEISDHQPIEEEDGPSRALRVTVRKEDKVNVVKISDWMPESEPTGAVGVRGPSSLSQLPGNDYQRQQFPSNSDSEFHFILELAELGISIVDHTPEEILYMSVKNLLLAYSTGLGSGFSRFKLRIHGIQVDNQLPLTPMPVLFRPQKGGDEADYILKFSMTMQSNGSLDLCVYPYIGFRGPDIAAFFINIHEPIIWRLHEMMQQVNFSRLYETQTTTVSVDPIIEIGVLDISEIRFKVSMAMSPSQRPRGVLGFWSSLMTSLGNTENMPIRVNQRFHENVCMRQSTMISIAITNVKKDILGQPLQLLSGVDILGNASSALGLMSKGVAALSMDNQFIQGRQRQENKGVEDLGDVIGEGGGGAFAKGIFRGVTGILTKPLEGAKSSGVEGFVQGFGKGIIGAAAQPVSGVLDLLSKTTEGANAMRMKITSAITSEEQLLRRRLPRVIGGDNLVRPYNEYKAQGQVILQLAESGSFFGQVDLFKVRGKFALSDAYEDHFILPKGKIVMVTHRRVMLLQQPSTIIGQRKFNPAGDPCSVLWDVLWSDLMTMELNHGKKDQQKSPPSKLLIYLQSRSTELREQFRQIKCSRETDQALEVYCSVERAMNTYGRDTLRELLKNKVMKPYSPSLEGANTEATAKEGAPAWPPPLPPRQGSNLTFGSSSG